MFNRFSSGDHQLAVGDFDDDRLAVDAGPLGVDFAQRINVLVTHAKIKIIEYP